MEGSVRDRSELLRHGHFGFYVRKTRFFHDSLELREQEKSLGAKSS